MDRVNSFRYEGVTNENSNYNDVSSLESYQLLQSFNNLDLINENQQTTYSRTTSTSNYPLKNKPGTSVGHPPNINLKKPIQLDQHFSQRKET